MGRSAKTTGSASFRAGLSLGFAKLDPRWRCISSEPRLRPAIAFCCMTMKPRSACSMASRSLYALALQALPRGKPRASTLCSFVMKQEPGRLRKRSRDALALSFRFYPGNPDYSYEDARERENGLHQHRCRGRQCEPDDNWKVTQAWARFPDLRHFVCNLRVLASACQV